LALREIGMDPEAVSGLKVRDFGNRQSSPCTLDADVNFRADEVEGGIVGMRRADKDEGNRY
jgi:hypothetical protein